MISHVLLCFHYKKNEQSHFEIHVHVDYWTAVFELLAMFPWKNFYSLQLFVLKSLWQHCFAYRSVLSFCVYTWSHFTR